MSWRLICMPRKTRPIGLEFLPERSGGGDGARTHEPLDCQSSALPTELRPRTNFEPSISLLKVVSDRCRPRPKASLGVYCNRSTTPTSSAAYSRSRAEDPGA